MSAPDRPGYGALSLLGLVNAQCIGKDGVVLHMSPGDDTSL